MMAFLTRYNIALLIFPVLLYLLINREQIKDWKSILIGIFSSFLVIIPVFIFIYQKLGNILYPFVSTFGNTASSSFLPEYYPYDPNLLYFIERFPIYTGFEGMLILLIILAGLILVIFKFNKLNEIKKSFDQYKTKIDHFNLKLISFVILLIIFLLTFGQVNYMITEVIFFVLGFSILFIG